MMKLTGNQVLIRVSDLTKEQRKSLDRYVYACDAFYPGLGMPTLSTLLQQQGAKPDLSNVSVGFWAPQESEEHVVSLIFEYTLPDGNTDWSTNAFAELPVKGPKKKTGS